MTLADRIASYWVGDEFGDDFADEILQQMMQMVSPGSTKFRYIEPSKMLQSKPLEPPHGEDKEGNREPGVPQAAIAAMRVYQSILSLR